MYGQESQQAMAVFENLLSRKGVDFRRENRPMERMLILASDEGKQYPEIKIFADGCRGLLTLQWQPWETVSAERIPEMAVMLNEFNAGRILGRMIMDMDLSLIHI